jgi:hypothetical protein
MGKNQDPGKHPGSATLQIGMFYKKIQTVKIINFFSLLLYHFYYDIEDFYEQASQILLFLRSPQSSNGL